MTMTRRMLAAQLATSQASLIAQGGISRTKAKGRIAVLEGQLEAIEKNCKTLNDLVLEKDKKIASHQTTIDELSQHITKIQSQATTEA